MLDHRFTGGVADTDCKVSGLLLHQSFETPEIEKREVDVHGLICGEIAREGARSGLAEPATTAPLDSVAEFMPRSVPFNLHGGFLASACPSPR